MLFIAHMKTDLQVTLSLPVFHHHPFFIHQNGLSMRMTRLLQPPPNSGQVGRYYPQTNPGPSATRAPPDQQTISITIFTPPRSFKRALRGWNKSEGWNSIGPREGVDGMDIKAPESVFVDDCLNAMACCSVGFQGSRIQDPHTLHGQGRVHDTDTLASDVVHDQSCPELSDCQNGRGAVGNHQIDNLVVLILFETNESL